MNHHRYRLPMQADVAELHRAAGLPDRLDTAAEATGVIGRGVPLGKAESEETVRNLLRTGVHDLSAAVVDHDGPGAAAALASTARAGLSALVTMGADPWRGAHPRIVALAPIIRPTSGYDPDSLLSHCAHGVSRTMERLDRLRRGAARSRTSVLEQVRPLAEITDHCFVAFMSSGLDPRPFLAKINLDEPDIASVLARESR